MRLNLLFLLSIVFLISGCKEEGEQLYPLGQEYVFEKFEFDEIKGYVTGRELSKEEIAKFIIDDSFMTLDPYSYRKPDTLYFLPNKVAKYNALYDHYPKLSYTRSGNKVILTTDTVSTTSNCMENHWCNIFYNISQWKRDTLSSIKSGNQMITNYLVRMDHTIREDNIIVPRMVVSYVYNPAGPPMGTSYRSKTAGYVGGTFDKNILNKFIKGDTLVIREYKIILKRVK